MKTVTLKIEAPNDTNGNPRRGWLVWEAASGDILAFIDEGYRGNAQIRKRYPGTVDLGVVNVPPAEYRAHLRAPYAVKS